MTEKPEMNKTRFPHCMIGVFGFVSDFELRDSDFHPGVRHE
jgi:hypothetical protein